MHGDGRVRLLAGRPERVPVAGVERGEAELGRVLAEGDGVAALGGAAADLGGGRLGVPQRDERERDQTAPSGPAAPLVDHPVVVDLQTEQGERLVVPLGETLPGEARERVRVVDPDLLVVGVHVTQAGRLVVGARAKVLVNSRDVLVPLERHATGRVEAVGTHDEVVEEPDVGPGAVFDAALHREDAALERALRLLAHAAGSALAQRGRELALPEISGLEDVVVDRNDEGEVLFGRRGWCGGDGHGVAP